MARLILKLLKINKYDKKLKSDFINKHKELRFLI